MLEKRFSILRENFPSIYTVLQYWLYCLNGFLCTLSCPRAFRVRSCTASSCAHSASTSPTRRPSSTTGMEDWAQGGRGAPVGVIPRLHSSLGRWLMFGVEVVTCRKNSRVMSSCTLSEAYCTGVFADWWHVYTVGSHLFKHVRDKGVSTTEMFK